MHNSKQLDFKLLPSLAKQSEAEWKKYFVKNKKKIEGMDTIIQGYHQEISKKTDCLACGNCCRSLGPRITDKDIERIAKALRIKAVDVLDKYLKTDEDGDTVFKTMPCPFLGNDNYCSIYENRPKACREYPHTDRKKFHQIYNLSILNAQTCPIVYEVMQKIVKT